VPMCLVRALSSQDGERCAGVTMDVRAAWYLTLVILIEENGHQALAHVPLHVTGQHAK
jgi:hypothetical protein